MSTIQRLLWYGNPPWALSGYGVQGSLVVPRLRDRLGLAVAFHCNTGLDGARLAWREIQCYPRGYLALGQDLVYAHAAHFRADLIVSLADAWTLAILPPSGNGTQAQHVVWAPIDHEPLHDADLRELRKATHVIAMTRAGQTALTQAGIAASWIPHCIDLAALAPVADRVAARRAIFAGRGTFVVGMVGANSSSPSRKAFPQSLIAFKHFRERHPDSILYLHTQQGSPPGNGVVDLMALVASLGLTGGVVFADQYRLATGDYDTGAMARLFTAFDVLLQPSLGEGFGVPIVEAQACGCPVIAGEWTGMGELVRAGIRLPRAGAEPFWTPQNAYQFVPRVDAIVGALEATYAEREQREARAEHVRAGVREFDADFVVDHHWRPVINALASAPRFERSGAGAEDKLGGGLSQTQ